MTTPTEYVLQLKAKLAISPIVASFNVIVEKVWPDRGYIHIRMVLSNGDFLEAAEYFVLQEDDSITRRYQYKWMDGERRELRKRWDMSGSIRNSQLNLWPEITIFLGYGAVE